jgi:hypothetical protein
MNNQKSQASGVQPNHEQEPVHSDCSMCTRFNTHKIVQELLEADRLMEEKREARRSKR